MKKFDVFVIGTGVSGTAVANTCANQGLSVGITDERAYGGTCAIRGCIPKKVLWGVIHVTESANRLSGKGIDQIPKVNWSDLMAFKSTFTNKVPKEKEKKFIETGIAVFHGGARFVKQNQLQINDELLEAKKIVIATGAKPRKLNVRGAEHLCTSDDFLNMEVLPEHILFVGGGYIAFEFAHMAALCGSNVTIVERDASPLKNFEHEMVKQLIERSKDIGIRLELNTEVEELVKTENGYKVITRQAGLKNESTADLVINSTGRVPAIFDLDLEKGNVAHSDEGIKVSPNLQSISNRIVYASGDVSDSAGLALTPVASMEARVISSQLSDSKKSEGGYAVMPSVVFTHPPMASVGFTEKEALDRNLNFKVKSQSVRDWFTAKGINAPVYAYKILISKETEKLLGAHLVGPHAEETINLFAMAMTAGFKAKEIRKILFAFPSSSSDISSMLI